VSEQAVIGDATIVMRSRFRSGSQRISYHLSWIEAHAEQIRADVRGSISASAEKIQTTLKQLTDQMDRLPEDQWEGFKAMLKLLRAQQNVLDSAEALIQMARANTVSPKRPSPMIAPAMRGIASLTGEPGLDPEVHARRLRKVPGHKKYFVAVMQGTASLRLVLVGIVAAGLVFGHVTITRDGKRQDVAAKTSSLTTGGIGRPVASLAAPQERSLARVSYDNLATPLPATEVPLAADARSISATSLTLPHPTTLPTPLPSGVVASNRPDAAAIARGSDERYVPVIFTDKDQTRALQAFAELQLRYPKLLSPRRAEAQPVDLGQKGIWHRLIVLPPGSRQSATDFCDQLLGAGYDRCWVKAY
jgi:hypothetical protein